MNYYERALELKDEIVENRRYFHTNAEVGLDMPKAKAYVMKKLTEYGLEPKECAGTLRQPKRPASASWIVWHPPSLRTYDAYCQV